MYGIALCLMLSAIADADAASEPFAWGDFSWLNGASRQNKHLLDYAVLTGQVDLDINYTYSLNRPNDDTVVGSTPLARNNEVDLAFLGFGGDLHWDNVRGRVFMQFGTRSTAVPRNDASANRGQFTLATAYRYITEAYSGYHWDVWHGLNLDVGLFMSYVGLFSYTSFENWGYQPSFTSDNTPWYFNGARLQAFLTDRFKIELWLVNGWQSYGKFNTLPGVGFQLMWRPEEWLSLVTNGYVGTDTQDAAWRVRYHSDTSGLLRYYDNAAGWLNGAAISVTFDLGFENGDGVSPFGEAGRPAQNFISSMAYHRMWFCARRIGWTVGGGFMHNPGRYLVIAPSGVAGEFFSTGPGTTFDAWDMSTTFDWMPNEHATWRFEIVHRQASVPYFAGRGGVTSPDGYVTTPSGPDWRPDLSKAETRAIAALIMRF